MRRPSSLAISILLSFSLALPNSTLASANPTFKPRAEDLAPGDDIQAFDLLTPTSGWLLTHLRLYWSDNTGQTWTDITPSLGAARARAVTFLDAQRGWLIATDADPAGGTAYTLARTSNGGKNWRTIPLALFDADDVSQFASAVYLHFLDARTGWLVVKRATSRNFSVGALFKTADGGDTWERLTLPIGEPVYFVMEHIGWVAGGAAGDELYRTEDGGRTWRKQTINSLALQSGDQLRYRRPLFESARVGVLPLTVARGDAARLEFHLTRDGGATWRLAHREPLAGGSALPLAIFDSRQWLLLTPHGIEAPDSQRRASSPKEWASKISELDMISPEVGWAKYLSGACAPTTGCVQEIKLLRTTDGGRTWTALRLPGSEAQASQRAPFSQAPNLSTPQTPRLASVQSAYTRTVAVTGHGFDSCTLPGLSQMQDWMTNSPYRVWNLYLGGSSRANCGALTAWYIAQLADQGWRFIPTWVGPQAACSGFLSRMSYDPATAYTQGVNEANAAINAAEILGLTFADKSGTIIYYDLEAYDVGNDPCREAARAFISGWSGQLQARANQAGVYGSTCGSAIADFAGGGDIPDAVWLAAWLIPYQYRSNVTVWNLPCLSNTLWVNSQRLRQYAGGHDETWGNTLLNIDSSVLAGVVADISRVPDEISPIEIYLEPDFGGEALCFIITEGWFNVASCAEGWDDQVSSLKLQPGWSARVFRDANRGGPALCYILSDPDLTNDWFDANTRVDNQISSIELFHQDACPQPYSLYLPLAAK